MENMRDISKGQRKRERRGRNREEIKRESEMQAGGGEETRRKE